MSALEQTAEEAISGPPRNKREAGMLITRIGRALLARSRKAAKLKRRISKWKQKATALEEERKELDALCIEELHPLADDLADFATPQWDELAEKGTRTIRFGTGEMRLRDIGRPTITVKDPEAFFREARRKGLARKLIRTIEQPNIDALHDDLALAKRFSSVSITFVTKLEIRPKHADDRLEASVPAEEDEWSWSIASPRTKRE
jgi:phage host-nuclease inhibitor protein Gam